MISLATLLFLAFALYVLWSAVFLILENRRPQSTIAWLLAFIFLPGIGLLAYVLVGRDNKAFSRANRLLHQNLERLAQPLLGPLIQRQDRDIVTLLERNPGHRRLIMLIRRNSYSMLTRGNSVEICQDANEFYPRLLADMKSATRFIHHQYYIWRSDEFGREVQAVAMERAAKGVEVRILYDPVGSFMRLSRRAVRELSAAGIEVVPTSDIWRLHTLGYRNHRKLSVIDGRIGYAGGMNIGSEHLTGGSGFSAWRDTQIRLEGDSAKVLQAVFAVDWYNATRRSLFSPDYFLPAEDSGGSEGVPVQLLVSGPDSQWAAIRQLYTFMIMSAQERVFVQSPFFIPDPTIAEAMTNAALAGVDVRLMISARPSGSQLPQWATRTYLAELREAGVRVFLYDAGYLHAKTISVDSGICSIGSANIDIRSFSINYELNAVIYDALKARQLESDFERDMQSCREFDAEAYASRGLGIRFRDSTARLLSPLL